MPNNDVMINCNVCVYVYMGNAPLYLMLSFIVSIIIIILHSSIGYKKLFECLMVQSTVRSN